MDQHQVLLGTVNRNVQAAWSSGVLGRQNLYPHFSFNPITFNNDIGLISIPSNPTILFIPGISTIALPLSSDANINFAGRIATASGFGVTIAGSHSNLLQAVDLEIIANLQCSTALPQYITLSNICTANPAAQSVCYGDGGKIKFKKIHKNFVKISLISRRSFGHSSRGWSSSDYRRRVLHRKLKFHDFCA